MVGNHTHLAKAMKGPCQKPMVHSLQLGVHQHKVQRNRKAPKIIIMVELMVAAMLGSQKLVETLALAVMVKKRLATMEIVQRRPPLLNMIVYLLKKKNN